MTRTSTPIDTWTATATPPSEVFDICKNVFHITQDGQVCIIIGTAHHPGPMSLRIYNTAGEHIKTLYDAYLDAPMLPTTLYWDGSNKYGQKVASGVYVVYLINPYTRKIGRLVVIH